MIVQYIHGGVYKCELIVWRMSSMFAYILCLVFHMIKSAIDVAYVSVIGGINPQIIEVKTILKKPLSQLILANSITLTPGTLTIDVDSKNQALRVAVLTPRPVAAVIPFEPYIRGMLE